MNQSTKVWKAQGSHAVLVEASALRIWSLLEDGQQLSRWMPAVKRSDGGTESVGSTRRCDVSFEGRDGFVLERCVVADRPSRIAWELVEDSLGFSKLLRGFAFDFVLRPVSAQVTEVVQTTFFEARGLTGRLMVALFLRAKFRTLRSAILANIKILAEDESAPRAAPQSA